MQPAVVGWTAAALLALVALVPLATAWTEAQDLGHGWAAPLLVAFLWWERWSERPGGVARDRIGARWWWFAALVAVGALALRLPLTPFPLWPVVLWAFVGLWMAVTLGGAWLAAGGPGVRWVGGPLLVMLGSLPWPTAVELNLVGPMREGLAAAAAEVCYLFGVTAQAVGTTVRLPHSWVGVDETCGGMRSLQACVMAALFLGEWLRLAWPRRVSLIAVSMGAAVLGNFLRILLLVWRASVGGEPAMEAVHDLAGWLALGTSLGVTGLVARALRGAPAAAPENAGAPPARLPLPRVALAWIAVLAGAFVVAEAATRAWYWWGGASPPASVARWNVRFPDRQADFRGTPLSKFARELLQPDFFVAGDWQDDQQRLVSAYYLEWRSRHSAHNPTVCLEMAGCELVRPLGTVSVRWAGGEIPFQTFRYRRGGVEFAVGFALWDPFFGRPVEDESGGWTRLMAARFRRIREGRAAKPAQLLTVAVWGDHPEDHLVATIQGLIVGAK